MYEEVKTEVYLLKCKKMLTLPTARFHAFHVLLIVAG
jgi:hypothetical protein